MSSATPTFRERPQAAAIARGLTIDAVRDRREEARRFLSAGLAMIERGLECGADLAFLQDTAAGLHDALTRIMGGLRRDLDNAGARIEDADIDLGDLNGITERRS